MSMISGGPRNEPRPPRPPRPPMPMPPPDTSYLPGASNSRPGTGGRGFKNRERYAALSEAARQTDLPRAKNSNTPRPLDVPDDPRRSEMDVQESLQRLDARLRDEARLRDSRNAQIPGVDFMNFITGSGVRDRGQMMPMPRNIDPGTDAILRAIMARMQGGQ